MCTVKHSLPGRKWIYTSCTFPNKVLILDLITIGVYSLSLALFLYYTDKGLSTGQIVRKSLELT